MSSSAQITANQANAQHSTGPKTAEGIARSSINNFRHGLTGAFTVLAWEKQEQFDQLLESLRGEHTPSTPTETLLVERIAQHPGLSRRAILPQDKSPQDGLSNAEDDKGLPLYIH